MSLNTANLKADIKSALLDQRNNTDDPTAAADDLANKIANAVETFVKTLQITYTAGLVDASGPVTGDFNYTLS